MIWSWNCKDRIYVDPRTLCGAFRTRGRDHHLVHPQGHLHMTELEGHWRPRCQKIESPSVVWVPTALTTTLTNLVASVQQGQRVQDQNYDHLKILRLQSLTSKRILGVLEGPPSNTLDIARSPTSRWWLHRWIWDSSGAGLYSTPDVSRTIHEIKLKAMEALFLWISRSILSGPSPSWIHMLEVQHLMLECSLISNHQWPIYGSKLPTP